MNLEGKCQQHWINHRLTDINALKEHIENIFTRYDHQKDVLIELYKLVFPEWDRISKMIGYPEVGNELWQFICRRFQKFDQEHHPGFMPGGAWMNTGFSVNPKLDPWEVDFTNCCVEYQQPEVSEQNTYNTINPKKEK